MKLQTLKTNEYWLLIDTESDIPQGNYFLLGELSGRVRIHQWRGTGNRYNSELSNLIIGHLPVGNSPLLESIALLPELPKQEEDVQEAESWVNDSVWGYPNEGDRPGEMMFEELKKAFLAGKASKEKKYSEEDLRNAFEAARETSGMNQRNQFAKKYKNFADYLQSLSPVQESWEFVPQIEWEYEDMSAYNDKDGFPEGGTWPKTPDSWQILKTTTNTEGKEFLLGKWIKK